MADIEKIKVGSTTYNVKDTGALRVGTNTIGTASEHISEFTFDKNEIYLRNSQNDGGDGESSILLTNDGASIYNSGKNGGALTISSSTGLLINGITVPENKTGQTFAVTSDIPSTPAVYNANLNLQINGGTATKLFSANASSTATLSVATGNANGSISVGNTDVPVKGLANLTTVSEIPLANLPIVANPTATGTTNLTKLKLGSTIYNISGGGSSGVSSFNNRTGAVTLQNSDVSALTQVGTTSAYINFADSTMHGNGGWSVTFDQIVALVGCVIAGTKITMADGSFKNVEDIDVGDEVLGYDFMSNTAVPTVVLMNRTGRSARQCRMNMFEDGTILSTVDEHFLYNASELGAPVSNIENWKVCDKDKAMKADGSTVRYCGYFNKFNEDIRSFNILTSNNTYFANGLLNTVFPPSKFHHLSLSGRKMPTELYEAVKQELRYSRNGGYNIDNPEFLKEILELEDRSSEIDDNITKKKQALTDSDYQIAKSGEAVMQALLSANSFEEFKLSAAEIFTLDIQEKIERRISDRQYIKEHEALNAQLKAQIYATKEKYRIIDDFEKLPSKEQFAICNKLGNDNYEAYKDWLCPEKDA